jgi:hypothetical protein
MNSFVLCPHGKMNELASEMGAHQKQICLVIFYVRRVLAVLGFDVVCCHYFSD